MRQEHGVDQAIFARAAARIFISAITLGEAWSGALRSANAAGILSKWEAFLRPFDGRVLAFDEQAAREYGGIRADLRKRGIEVGDHDCMIAAIARVRSMTVVTRNHRDFSRIAGLRLENWVRR